VSSPCVAVSMATSIGYVVNATQETATLYILIRAKCDPRELVLKLVHLLSS
jgi:hypothetical protein